MKKTLQSLEHFIQSINNLENQNNGALPLGMRSQREIIKKLGSRILPPSFRCYLYHLV